MKPIGLVLACSTCRRRFRVLDWKGEERVSCPYGAHPVELRPFQDRARADACPVCGKASFYREKRFPRALGLGLLALGIALSFWTYGLSLAAFAALDAVLYWLLAWRLVCYTCGTEIEGVPPAENQQAFDLHLHERYRSQPAARP